MSSEQLWWPTMRVQDVPSQLWRLYVAYLWDPAPGSWVSAIAYMFRIVAIAIVFPFALLTLLDIVSYVIARTLGVVETTRASTSDKRGLVQVPVVVANEDNGEDGREESRAQTPTPDRLGVEEQGTGDPSLHVQAPDSTDSSSSSSFNAASTAFFFSPTEEKSLELSGGNILSPAMSRQGSPTAERHRDAAGPGWNHNVTPSPVEEEGEESITMLRRRGGATSVDAVPQPLD